MKFQEGGCKYPQVVTGLSLAAPRSWMCSPDIEASKANRVFKCAQTLDREAQEAFFWN